MKEAKQDSFRSGNLIRLLKSFTKEERAEFSKYVHSQFNPRKEVARFFDELKKFFPSFENKKFTKEFIFSQLYPGTPYKDDVIRKHSSNLFKLAEDFIAYKMFTKDEYEQRKRILEYYSQRFDDNLFLKHAEKMNSFLEKQHLRNAEYYYRLKHLNNEKALHLSKYDATRKKFDNTAERIEQTWQYCIIGLFAIYDAAVNDMMYFNKEYDVALLSTLMEIYENPAFPKSAASQVYYYSIKLITDGRNDETFFLLKNLLENNTGIFQKDELFGFYTGLHNYLFEKGLVPDADTSRLEFEVGVKMLELGLITEGDTITAEWFANMFLKAVKANEIEFAEKFILDYKMKLAEKERDNIINYAYAELEWAKKNHLKVLSYLARIKFNNVWEKLRVNHMYIKIHYEMNNGESFYYIIDSFRHLIKNEASVNEYVKNLHESFIKFAVSLFRIKSGDKNLSIEQVKDGIINSKSAGMKWLLQKAEELKNLKIQ
jgi:hypothetical protein